MNAASLVFFALAALGAVLVVVQAVFVRRFLRRPVRRPTRALPGISVLKPLRGTDDGLEENLRAFAALDYPDYEVLLGFKSADDPAMALAQDAVARWPHRFRIVMQVGEPGLNPKVNQLITLAREAAHELVVVSDGSVRPRPDYLAEIAAFLEDPQVGLVTHPMAGTGERTLAALFDNVYLTTHFIAGPLGAKQASDQDLVLGKSMAMRKTDLALIGGFEAAKDYLAEDFVIGRWVSSRMGKRVAFGRGVQATIAEHRTLGRFLQRYGRWAVLQRHAGGLALYCAQTLMYPTTLAAAGFFLSPSWRTLALLAAVALVKSTTDLAQMRMLRPSGLRTSALFLLPFHDLLIGLAWLQGLFNDRVEWRGNPLRVTRGTRLVPISRGGVEQPVAPEQDVQAGDLSAR